MDTSLLKLLEDYFCKIMNNFTITFLALVYQLINDKLLKLQALFIAFNIKYFLFARSIRYHIHNITFS